MKIFLYYSNYSEFNLENSDILYFGAYTIYTNPIKISLFHKVYGQIYQTSNILKNYLLN